MSKPTKNTGAPIEKPDPSPRPERDGVRADVVAERSFERRPRRVFVDGIDDDIARLMWHEEAFTIPASLLPSGVREGAWLNLWIARDERNPGSADDGGDADEDDGEDTRRRLAKDDPGGDIKL